MIKKEKISISRVSIVFLFLLATVVFCSFGLLFYNYHKRGELNEIKNNLNQTADQLSKGLSIAIWNFDEDQVLGILESALLDKNITCISVEYNDKDKTIISILRDKKDQFKIHRNKIRSEPGSLTFNSDIFYNNEKMGELSIFATTALIDAETNKDATILTLFILIAVLLIMLGVYGVFYFIIIKPIKALEKFSLSINFENYVSTAEIRGSLFKELDQLRYSLEEMLTSLKASYKKLERSERKYKQTVDLLPMSVFETNLDGQVVFSNKKGLELFGMTQEDFEKGISVLDIVVEGCREEVKRNVASLYAGKTFSDGNEYLGLKKDGATFPVKVYSSVAMEGGKPIGIRGVGIDLTEQRKHEEALNELIQLNFAKEKEFERLRALSLMEGQEQERLRISREVHDGIGQMMTGIKLSSESIDPNAINSQADREKFEYTKSLIYDVIAELRQVSSDLSPTFLYTYGLFLAINQLVVDVSKITKIKIEFNSNIEKKRFLSLVEITIYRIIQEALNNAVKYSKANNLKIAIIEDAEFLELTVEDDGIGADLSAPKQTNSKSGNGLKNISARANLIGANFNIISSPGNGFQISVQIPLANATL